MATNLETAITEYLENADYSTDESTTKAKTFIVACRKLLILLPREVSHSNNAGVESTGMDPVRIENQLKEAESFLASASEIDTGGYGETLCDLRNFRT
jgi:hypothetical protein